MPNSLYPIVAIIGQPNVGKSTLLNKIAGRPMAVTSPVAGTTRDRQYEDIAWNGIAFSLVDTAGLTLGQDNELELNLNHQIEIAVEEADVLLLVVDGRLNRFNLDQNVLKKFRSTKKPLLLALNKLDSPTKWEEKMEEFKSYGIKKMFPISSINGRGIGDLLDEVTRAIDEQGKSAPKKEEEDKGIAISIVGKPNVGKSSIFNAILKEERTVVSSVPGTTRTAIDEEMEIGGQKFTFIDTAGLKKKVYRQEVPDIYGGFQTFKSIRRSDVCFFVIDSTSSLTKQDQRIADEIFSQDKGVVILANKTDKLQGSKDAVRDYVSFHFPFLWMCPLIFASAHTSEGLDEAIEAAREIYGKRQKTIDSQTLSEFLSRKLKINPPKLLRDQKNPKVFSLHQTDINPPRFELLVNHPAAISQQFRKFLENSIIKELDFWGTPIKLVLKGKDKA